MSDRNQAVEESAHAATETDDLRASWRRRLLKTIGAGLLVGTADALVAPAPASASGRVAVEPSAFWMHAQSLVAADPEAIELDALNGGAKQIRGASFSTQRLHFAIPSARLRSARGTRIDAVLLRFKTLPGAQVAGLRVFDRENEIETLADLNLRPAAWTDFRLEMERRPALEHGGSVSIEVAFDAVGREILFSAVGYESSEY